MCGIAGIVNLAEGPPVEESRVRRMLAMLRHRGPDQFGVYLDESAGLGSARLSIIDLGGGQQPIANEDETMWIVFNGEIFNYVELRPQLEALGHRFTTRSDTEVVLHLYEEFGDDCLRRLNGQFAIAIWNSRKGELFLARDRLGIRPLFYARHGGRLCFASEMKAILSGIELPAELDLATLLDVFTFWGPLPGKTAFRHVEELPPGHFLLARGGEVQLRRYWQMDFAEDPSTGASTSCETEDHYLEEFQSLLVDAVRVRLRADVPVGAYLSGGLDSSTIAAVVRKHTGNRFDTFSIAFTDVNFDEREHQRRMAEFLGTDHQVVEATHADIGRVFPDVVWHCEAPILRTAPAPMFLLSGLVQQSGFKVVLTGEGADEFLAGYDIFKEAQVRRFWARQPGSRVRPALIGRLYRDIFKASQTSRSFLTKFFREGLADVDSPDYSHTLRWRNGRRVSRFFQDDVLERVTASPRERIMPMLPPAFNRWKPLARAQFIEVASFLSPYLLSSQGDRMTMAHSVEGRYPFLDFRVVEFCDRLPSLLKLRGLQDKRLLRRLARRWLPAEICQRRKQPYRAPIHRCFFNDKSPDYVRELLSADAIKRSDLFRPAAVGQLVAKLDQGRVIGETDDMALAGILSTQLLHSQFIQDFPRVPSVTDTIHSRVRVCRRLRHPQHAL